MMGPRSLVAALSLLVTVGACGAGPIPAQEFPERYGAAVCDMWVRCGAAPTRQACLEANVHGGSTLEQERRGVAAGRLGFDEDLAAACVSAYEHATCDWQSVDAAVKVCAGVFTPLVSAGGPCALSGECIDGRCRGGLASSDPCQLGTCVARPGAGEPCLDGVSCASGLVCNQATGLCGGYVGEGVACLGDAVCDAGLYCTARPGPTDALEPGVCRRREATGGACSPYGSSCAAIDDVCDGATCVPRQAIGAACGMASSPFTGYFDDCEPGAFCDAGTCRARGLIGEPCSNSFGCLGAGECVDGRCLLRGRIQLCE